MIVMIKAYILRFKKGIADQSGFWHTQTKGGVCKDLNIVSLPEVQLCN